MIGSGIVAILFWIFVGIAIGGLLAWLFGSSSSSSTAEKLGLADFEGKTVTVRSHREHVVDQLELIEGIGPKISQLLHDNGIHRFAQIADMTPVDITKMLRASGHEFDIARPFTWPFQASLLANGWLAEFFEVREELRAGRFRLQGIKGIGEPTSDRLHALGIGSVPVLAEQEAAPLAAKLLQSGEEVTEGNVGDWIDQARRLLMGDPGLLAAAFGLAPTVASARTGATYSTHEDVQGEIVDAHSLAGLLGTTATATARPSLLPFWIGLIGAALMALLSALGLGGEDEAAPAPVAATGPTVLSTELGTDTLFETDSAVLTDAGKAEIDSKIVEPARNHLVSRVRVVGHADVRGDDDYNRNLSRERAASVAEYMRERAVAEGIEWDTRAVQVFGAGEEFPNPVANTAVDCAAYLEGDAGSAEAAACFAPDRRVHVEIIANN